MGRGRVGDVGDVGRRAAALALDALQRRAEGAGVAVDAEHARALAREEDRGGAAVAPAVADAPGAGDDGHAIGEPCAHRTSSATRKRETRLYVAAVAVSSTT